MATLNLKINRYLLSLVLVAGLLVSNFIVQGAASAACSALPTDRGTVTATVNIQTAGTYRVWSRIKTADSTKNSFYMQINETMCNTAIGDASLTPNTWTWVDYKDGNTASKVSFNFATSGNHTIKLAGKEDDVMVDRIILTQDTSCVPVGTGDNCSDPAPPADTTPPTISSISVSSITQTSATVTWATNEAADSRVNYGTSQSYGSNRTSATRVTSHSLNITGLTAGTTYNYQVVSKDAAGNTQTSSNRTFSTLAPAADTTKPTVSITAPANGANVSNTVTVTTSASDNVGVAGVQFKLDGVNLGAEDTTAGYSTSWNTKLASNGSHTLTAVARDAAGNIQTSSSVVVTVNNTTVTYINEDINSDGKVDIIDFSILSTNYGRSGSNISPARADVDRNGKVDIIDFSRLSSKYGQ